jgi:hypothetical protein
MLVDLLSNTLQISVIAKAAITWTPATFYVASGIVHTLVILLAYKLLHVDPEHNTFAGALIGAAVGNGAVFFLSGFGLFGVLGAGAIYFAILCAISSGEVAKSLMVFVVLMGVYAGMGHFITQRTPLTADQIGGLPRAIMTGGLTAEPITEEQTNELAEPASEK